VKFHLVAIVLTCATILCVSTNATSSLASDCVPSFPYSVGWLGGDAAYSIPLNDGRTVWLLGDSFIGAREAKSRVGSTMVANAIAISDCRDGHWHIEYYWNNRSGVHSARAFFDAGDSGFGYWPGDGFVDRGKLYVVLMRVEKTAAGGAFGFKFVGVDLATIVNPSDSPEQWSVSYLALARNELVSIVVQPPYAYLFGLLDDATHQHHGVILTRISLNRLSAPAKAIEHLARDGTWRIGADWRDARVIVQDCAPEFSVRYHPEIGKWILVQQQARLGSGQIGIRKADRLEGPWSAFQAQLSEPEMAKDGFRNQGIFCYAAKEHAELAPAPRTLLVTYVCNSEEFRRLTLDMSIYHPVVVRLKLP